MSIKVILVTDDRAHAELMLGAFARSPYPCVFVALGSRETLAAELEAELETVRGRLPVIVMIDFSFVLDACEAVLVQIAALKGDMAIECLVTRPPKNDPLCDRLREQGVFVFRTEPHPLPVLELH